MSQDVEELTERLNALESRVESLEEEIHRGEISLGSDLRDFVESCAPGTHKERATAIAFYLVHERDLDPFTSEDIEDGYVESRMSLPANPSDVLANSEDRGWLMRVKSSGNRQQWTITGDGEEAVQEGFDS